MTGARARWGVRRALVGALGACCLLWASHSVAAPTTSSTPNAGGAVLAEAERGLPAAISLLEVALARIDAQHPTDTETALTLTSLWLAYQAAGRAERSATAGQRLQSWLKTATRSELEAFLRVETDIAEYYRTNSNLTRAALLHQFVLELRKWLFRSSSVEAADSMAYLGLTKAQLEQYAEAIPLYRESLQIRRAKLAANDLKIAASAHNLAAALRATGKPDEAEPLYQEALRIREAELGPDDPDVAVTLTSLGLLDWQRGNPTGARDKLERALRIYQKARPGQLDVALTQLNLGSILLQKGNYDLAEPMLRRALAWFESHRPQAGVTNLANALNTLAVLERLRGDMNASRGYEARARSLTTGGDTSPTLQAALGCNAGSDQSARGNLDLALQSYEACLQTLRTTLGGDHNADVAYAQKGLALVYGKRREWARGEALATKAVATLRDVEGRTSGVAGALDTLAVIHRASGRVALAVSESVESAEIQDSVLAALLGEGASRDKRSYFRTIQPNTYKLLSLNLLSAPNDPVAIRLGLQTLLRRKGRVLDAERDTLANARRHATPADVATLDELRSLRSRIAASLLGRGNRLANAGADEFRTRADELERQLAQRYPGLGANRQPITLEAVQSRMTAKQALVELAYLDAVPAHELEPNIHDAEWEYAAYVLPGRGAPRAVSLGAAKPIDELVQRLQTSLVEQQSVAEVARQLDAAVMAKIRPLLGDAREIIVSPDGALNTIPFAALIDEQGNYLIENYDITYVTSGRDLLRDRTPARGRDVIVAVSEFGKPTSGQPPSRAAYPSLPGAVAEAELVGHFLPNASVLSETAATKDSLLALRGPRILHAATHAKFSSPAVGEDPLLASEIALANANASGVDGARGVLTALETSSLDLSGTEMVVLSACDSGRGAVANGDGVYGLRRSLVLAGARTQVLSLWQIEDGRTQELLGAFYRNLAHGSSRGQALRDAQLSLSRQPHTRHPIYWANLTLSGDRGPLAGIADSGGSLTTAPGSRGCACSLVGSPNAGGSAWLALAVALGALFQRRRSLSYRVEWAVTVRVARAGAQQRGDHS